MVELGLGFEQQLANRGEDDVVVRRRLGSDPLQLAQHPHPRVKDRVEVDAAAENPDHSTDVGNAHPFNVRRSPGHQTSRGQEGRSRPRTPSLVSGIKSIWASVQGDPVFMRRVNGWLTIFWIVMIPVSLATAG